MSVLLDELEQGNSDYILVSEMLDLLSKATKNSPIADVKTYLLAHAFEFHMPVYYREGYFEYEIDISENEGAIDDRYESTYRALTSELMGNEYFSIFSLNEFPPIEKYDIFAYRRGYHYVATQSVGYLDKGDYVVGLSDKNIKNLLQEGSIRKVITNSTDQTITDSQELANNEVNNAQMMSIPIANRAELKVNEQTTIKALEKLENDNADLNIKLDNAINICKKQQREIETIKDQLKQAKAENNQLLMQEKTLSINSGIKESQGDSLLILGAVMHCIKEATKKNFTQDLLTNIILDKYRNVSGISKSTLEKKYSESKIHINQRLTP